MVWEGATSPQVTTAPLRLQGNEVAYNLFDAEGLFYFGEGLLLWEQNDFFFRSQSKGTPPKYPIGRLFCCVITFYRIFDRRNRFRFDKKNNNTMEERRNDDLPSKKLRAGRRTYFFDLKQNRGNGDYYMDISESRKTDDDRGFNKDRIRIYPEDVNRFEQAIVEIAREMRERMPDHDFERFEKRDAAWEEER